jgi:general nucleoside transport system ATP-binding protein
MTARTDAAAPPLAVRDVGKRFGAVQALAGVSLDFRAGEIHALLGENGAGKSTLMHILAGLIRPDAGTVVLDGSAVTFSSARAARQAGIGMVHQHFTLVEALSVAENLALSLPGQSAVRFDAAAAATEARALAERIGLELSAPDAPVVQLPVGARQRLEIVKALAAGGRVLILDEPTAVLTPQEVRPLFAMLRQLRAQRRAVIFITHKLHEVNAVADRVSIMRRGRIVGTYDASAISENAMAELMVGTLPQPSGRVARHAGAAAVLQVADLTVHDGRGVPALRGVSFEVRAGEILGMAGVDGNGQRELFEVLVGLRQPASGTVGVGGHLLTEFTPRAALAAGIGHIPPDRQHEGLVLPMTVRENFLLNRTLLDRFSRHGMLQRDAAVRFATELAEQYALQFASLDAPVRSLSGGNQQRVVVARSLAGEPQVLVTVNPTRGLDFAATAAVADALHAVARRGCAVVLISTDLDEVLDLSDRVRVLARGALSAALEPPIDAERLGLLMAGAAAGASHGEPALRRDEL